MRALTLHAPDSDLITQHVASGVMVVVDEDPETLEALRAHTL